MPASRYKVLSVDRDFRAKAVALPSARLVYMKSKSVLDALGSFQSICLPWLHDHHDITRKIQRLSPGLVGQVAR